jgi:nucleoside-diphosphate-sugar epimerase
MTRFVPKFCLVTGAAGFVGARVAQLLLDQGWHVIGVDNLNNYYDPLLKRHRLNALQHLRFKFIATDIEDQQGLQQLFEQYTFEAVINLAARAGVRYSVINPHVYFTTNVSGNLNLLELARQHRIGKFILASTSSLYAGQPTPFVESLPVNQPISPYAASKKAAEVTAYTYHHLYGLDVSVLRFFTVYGPAGRPDMSIFRFIKWIGTDQPITLYGDGQQTRDFTYIDDIAAGVVAALKTVGFEIINLGGGQPASINQVLEILSSQLQKKLDVRVQPPHAADLSETWADVHKAQQLLGWRPKTRLSDGLQASVDWFLENRELVRAINERGEHGA